MRYLAANMEIGDLRPVDWKIFEALRVGRNNAPNLAEDLDYSQQYIRERLGVLKREGYVTAIGNGIYELNPDEVPEQESS